jgi:hypothetical protein
MINRFVIMRSFEMQGDEISRSIGRTDLSGRYGSRMNPSDTVVDL